MVSVEEIQAAYYMVAATGVLVAAVFYIMNLRETARDRRATFANNAWQNMLTPEWQKRWFEVQSLQWTDFEDFMSKYDTKVNPESWSKRMSVWLNFDSLGWQLREGLIDVNSLSNVWAGGFLRTWYKFKPIIEGYRGRDLPKDSLKDFEYLAGVLEKKLIDEDPDFMKMLWVQYGVQETHQ